MILLMMMITSSACFGAASDDVYLRKDVFEVYMQNLNANMERILQRLDRIDENLSTLNQTVANLSGRMDGLEKRMDSLEKRVDGNFAALSGRIDGLDKRIDDVRNGLYLWLVAIGLVVSWPKAKEAIQKFGKSTPSITLEDVRRLIEENNARTAGKAQA